MTHCVLSQRSQSFYHVSRMARTILFILFWALCCTCHAAYQSFTRLNKQPGLWGLLANNEQIDAYFFQSSTHSIVILDEGDTAPRYGSLAHSMKANHCVAGINGGYFAADAQRTPLGLIKHQKKTHHKLASGAFTVAGVLYDTGRTIKLERSTDLSTPVDAMKEAIQGGPFLVEKGRIIQGLDNKKLARRTFVATDGQGGWCIAVTTPITLRKLASWLTQPQALGNFKVSTALNMDGGTSTAIWIASPHLYRAPFKVVRNYIGVSPRSKAASKE